MPDKPEGRELPDLRRYHDREGKRYKLLPLIVACLALLLLAHRSRGLAERLGASGFAFVAALIGSLALVARLRGALAKLD